MRFHVAILFGLLVFPSIARAGGSTYGLEAETEHRVLLYKGNRAVLWPGKDNPVLAANDLIELGTDNPVEGGFMTRTPGMTEFNIEIASSPMLKEQALGTFLSCNRLIHDAFETVFRACKDKPAQCAAPNLANAPKNHFDERYYYIDADALVSAINKAAEAKPVCRLTPATTDHKKVIGFLKNGAFGLNFNNSQLNVAVPLGVLGSDPTHWLRTVWPTTDGKMIGKVFTALQGSVAGWLAGAGLGAHQSNPEVRGFFIAFALYFQVWGNGMLTNDHGTEEEKLKIPLVHKDGWGILIKTGLRDILRAIQSPAARAAIKTGHAGFKAKLKALCANADSTNTKNNCETLVGEFSDRVFAEDTARYKGESSATYGFLYNAARPELNPTAIFSPTHHPTPVVKVHSVPALVLEIRSGDSARVLNLRALKNPAALYRPDTNPSTNVTNEAVTKTFTTFSGLVEAAGTAAATAAIKAGCARSCVVATVESHVNEGMFRLHVSDEDWTRLSDVVTRQKQKWTGSVVGQSDSGFAVKEIGGKGVVVGLAAVGAGVNYPKLKAAVEEKVKKWIGEYALLVGP